ncbi:MAG: nitroreductase family protein [Clostridia bacterium]|nr:nitroreductase family protein [Clostridia bacterium]
MHDPMMHRRSIRKYTDRPVEQEKIDLMLRAAMAAPTACNQQPWEYYVVTNRDTIAQLARCSHFSKFAASAPVIIVACKRKLSMVPQFGDIDMAASVENLLLEADLQGLGTCWIGVAPQKRVTQSVGEVLNLPMALSAFAMIACGYPAEEKGEAGRFEEKRVHYIR